MKRSGNGERGTRERGGHAVINGGTGAFVSPARAFDLPASGTPTSTTTWLRGRGLDFAGNAYFTATFSGSMNGARVSSKVLATFDERAGFPRTVTGVPAVARPVNSLASAPLLLLPVLASSGSEVAAFNVVSGDVQPGFPVTLGSSPSLAAAAVDQSSNTFLVGSTREGNLNRVYFTSMNSSGQVRAGFPRVFSPPATHRAMWRSTPRVRPTSWAARFRTETPPAASSCFEFRPSECRGAGRRQRAAPQGHAPHRRKALRLVFPGAARRSDGAVRRNRATCASGDCTCQPE